jgi:hypothetical protein
MKQFDNKNWYIYKQKNDDIQTLLDLQKQKQHEYWNHK